MKKTKDENKREMFHKRVVAAAVALFLAGLVLWRYEGLSLQTAYSWLVMVILYGIAVTDQKTMKIPNRMTASLFIPAALSFFAEQELTLTSRIVGFGAVSLPMFLMTSAVPGSFGGGDMKLMAVCGLILGAPRILTAAFIAIVTGGCYAIWLLASGKGRCGDRLAFAPFLAAGMGISLLYGDTLLSWYLGLLGC